MRGNILKRMIRSPRAIIAVLTIGAALISATFAPILSRHDPVSQNLRNRVSPPSFEHVLGTDQLGRDVATRLMYGARISLVTGLASVGIALLLGIAAGAISGFFGGRVDTMIMAAIDVLLGFRTYLLAILVVAILGTSLLNLTIAIGVSMFPQFARIVRAEVLAIRSRDFVEAAEALGARTVTVMLKHVLPHAISSVLVLSTSYIATAIVVESSLSFLGLGPVPPTPSWGLMISEARRYVIGDAWLPIIPGIAIMLLVMAFNLLGDFLRDAFDPRMN